MSVEAAARSQVAVLGAGGAVRAGRGRASHAPRATRVIAFAALALYGTLKWSSLLAGAELARLLGLLLLAVALAGGRPWLAKHSRVLAALMTVIAVIAVLPLSGVPLEWLRHVRIAVTARAIGHGIAALPQVLVPYSGANHLVPLVIVLGAGMLLFDAALLVAFAPERMNGLRRASAAVPLVALAAVPTTLLRPRLPYVEGAILFALLVGFVWGDQIGQRRFGGALGLGVIATIAALFVAPRVDSHKPWFDYRGLAGGSGATLVEGFDWSQGYGPIDWPRRGRVVLEIKARAPEYWKAENLDTFNGVGWGPGSIPGVAPSPDASATERWTQLIQVTVRDMRISQVIGAGTSQQPFDFPEALSRGASPGTWATSSDLVPNDSYQVSVYAPDPSASQLAGAGTDYGSLPAGYRAIELPPSSGTPSPAENFYPVQTAKGYQPQLVFPVFHSRGVIRSTGGPAGASGEALIEHSREYARVYQLARALASRASTPYAFARAVESYLGRGFVYKENPPRSPYPLASFLLSSRRGYCQQFAGAMALLLRMGGVPARVAVGFTPGHRDGSTGRWVVTDYDAHAWVEAWFPHYGWVRFDPTPSQDPALAGHTPLPVGTGSDQASTGAALSASKTVRGANAGRRRHSGARAGTRRRSRSSAGSVIPWAALGVTGLAALVLLALATRPLRSADALAVELEAALQRIRRPLPGGATLAWLERRVRGSPDAAAYVRTLALARFGGGSGLPTSAQRRALRRQLRRGLGPFGFLRSIWALPPRRTHARRGSGA